MGTLFETTRINGMTLANRFIFSASCNTSIRTRWEVLKWFRDAWRELGTL